MSERQQTQHDPCRRCGPWCAQWLGDGLCRYEINRLAAEQAFYDRFYTIDEYQCPRCGAILTAYKVPGKLWEWPV